jgi:Rrf2 family nitric oxide-sensitive transcriptional repressor
MQLTRFTDYSLRVLIYLGVRPDEWVTIRQISEAYGISRNHLMKVVSFLSRQDYLVSQRGPGGGVRLKVPPGEINLANVIMESEGDMHLVECMREKSNCALEASCRLSGMLAAALSAFLETLNRYSLADMIEPGDELSVLLGIPATTA